MVRRGGKVCWPSSAVIPPIPSGYIEDFWLPARLWEPPTTPDYTPAPKMEIYLPVTGRQLCTVLFIPLTNSSAQCPIPAPYNITAPILFAEWRFFWLTDNANTTDAVNWRIGGYVFEPGDNFDTSGIGYNDVPQLSAGAYKLNSQTASVAISGPGAYTEESIYHAQINRLNDDAFPDNVYFIGARLSLGLPLI